MRTLFLTSILVFSMAKAESIEKTPETGWSQPVSMWTTEVSVESTDAGGSECLGIWWTDSNGDSLDIGNFAVDPGDTISLMTLVHLEGPEEHLSRIDAFYRCGELDPREWLQTSGFVDLGLLPGNPPGYGWIIGMAYIVPDTPKFLIDTASRHRWNGSLDCGIPLTAAPPCL